ncbi:uncharacterized protein F54H12.2 [Trichonephila clavipes]|uniref:Uncharacterized protein F54H12.2 n=1 Tax=Trichonephila clavipes TaxID=2585209 RepID=A0A8X6RY47_TRICX|nr:uncharacterized protein F54H12.2 [Trichonephila clavipes]
MTPASVTETNQSQIWENLCRKQNNKKVNKPNYRLNDTVRLSYGIGGLFKRLFRTALPFLTQGAKSVGKEVLKTGIQTANDLLEGQNLEDAAKHRAKETRRKLVREGIKKADDMLGQDKKYKRKKRFSKRPIPSKVRKVKGRDIFDTKVHINPGVLIAHTKALEKAAAKYPIDSNPAVYLQVDDHVHPGKCPAAVSSEKKQDLLHMEFYHHLPSWAMNEQMSYFSSFSDEWSRDLKTTKEIPVVCKYGNSVHVEVSGYCSPKLKYCVNI